MSSDQDQHASSAGRLDIAIEGDRRRLLQGERPLYHVGGTEAAGGVVDVTVAKLPIIHLFVPDRSAVLDGGMLLIARTLAVDPNSFDVALAIADTNPAERPG